MIAADRHDANSEAGFLPAFEKQWYAAYTRPHHEKCIVIRERNRDTVDLQLRGVTGFANIVASDSMESLLP